MRRTMLFLSAVLLLVLGSAFARPQDASDKPKDTPIPQQDIDKKNPVKPNADGMAAARKFYKYDCAMCHGDTGDGKGELAADMKLQLNDWRDTASISKYTDGALFYIISNGRGKMTGEGDRTSETARWNLVNLVRSFGKKAEGAAN
jgi:mono/diheme cytochrome c family protein